MYTLGVLSKKKNSSESQLYRTFVCKIPGPMEKSLGGLGDCLENSRVAKLRWNCGEKILPVFYFFEIIACGSALL